MWTKQDSCLLVFVCLFVCLFIYSLCLLQTLQSLLPTKPKDPIDTEDEVEEVDMIDFESTRGASSVNREAYDGDSDDDEPSGHRMG